MKKARLRLDTLIINSIMGGFLFTAGGMLHLSAQAENPGLMASNPGVVHLLQGCLYPIGLFYVVIMGCDLFNSNILYFTVGLCRGAVSVLDLLISWFVSWLFNLVATLFIVYLFCYVSTVARTPLYVTGSIDIAMEKAGFSFMETFLKSIVCNFCVCLAIYLQLLAKPVHVKFLMLFLPVFTFVTMGFNHTVADMFLVPIGIFNGADLSVGKYIWKLLIPASLGNIVGGAFFGIVIPFYLHLVVVERDQKALNLPTYEARDEQPELGADSRVVRVKSDNEDLVEDSLKSSSTDYEDDQPQQQQPEKLYRSRTTMSTGVSRRNPLTRLSTISTTRSRLSSPPGVFPVLGMGEPLAKERSIAAPNSVETDDDEDDQIDNIDQELDNYDGNNDNDNDNDNNYEDEDDISINSDADSETGSIAQSISPSVKLNKKIQENQEKLYTQQGGYNVRENKMSENLKRVLTKAVTTSPKQRIRDIESHPIDPKATSAKLFKSLSRSFSHRAPTNAQQVSRELRRHSINQKVANMADPIAGIPNYDNMSVSSKRRPSSVITSSSAREPTKLSQVTPAYINHFDNDNFEEQSVISHQQH